MVVDYNTLAFACIIIATLLRFILIYFNWPMTNSDEGNMGVLARHVAYNGEWPIFFYGLPYLGPVEGYLAAPLFHLFGPSVFTLRLGLLPFYPLFLVCMYYLTRRLYNQKFALFIVLLLCIGSDETISRQIKAVGEYPETIFFAAFISLLIVWLVQTVHTIEVQRRTSWKRSLIYGLLGIMIGIAIWVDMLILPVVGAGFLLLLLFCRRELWSQSGISLVLGMIIGAFPLVIYNVTAPFDQNSLIVLYNLHLSNGAQPHTFLQQVLGTIGISLPDVMNFNPMCIQDVATLLNGKQTACAIAQFSWGTGYLVIYGIALITTAIVVWRAWSDTGHWRHIESLAVRATVVRDCCRLMLLISAAGTMLAYVTSPNPATVPTPTSRYLTCLLIALPAVLWPLWNGLRTSLKTVHWPLSMARLSKLVQASVLLLFLVVSGVGTYRTFQDIPTAQNFYTAQNDMVQHLLDIGATRFYSEYWTCNRLIFQSDEKLICSSLSEHLTPGFDRYLPYRAAVRATRNPAYVFPKNSPQQAAMDARIQAHTLDQAYQRQEFHDYVIYFVPQKRLTDASSHVTIRHLPDENYQVTSQRTLIVSALQRCYRI
ncbi:MAG TPA: hypothetical protein VFU49_08215 [Ktedonobacteraceae bacterium]|nr:hypothetical protein [Ktedonobacteraceae bacterium]